MSTMPLDYPFCRDLWRRAARLADLPPATPIPPLAELRRTEWYEPFERLMRNRLLMGRYRYEALHSPAKAAYALIVDARRRLGLYDSTGNLEHLVDAANLLLLEFVHSRHPRRHFAASDDTAHCPTVEGLP